MKDFNLPNINYHEELSKCKTMDDLVGKDGLMQKLVKDMMQHLLEDEMKELYGINVSESMISKITNKVMASATACMDALKGLPEAIKSVYSDVNIQSCTLH